MSAHTEQLSQQPAFPNPPLPTDNNRIHEIDAEKSADADIRAIGEVFADQKKAFLDNAFPDYQTRLGHLRTLFRMVEENTDALVQALNSDFGCRSARESNIAEIVGSLSSIRYQMRNLRNFMKPERRRTSIWFLPGKGEVAFRPLGVVGVIAPWNYSVHLTMAPVAAALAAGNRVMAKMSELTPATSALVRRLVSEYFPADVVCVFDGEVEVSRRFSAMPFDHLLFTGSTAVGRLIAKAAAQNLTPVTLELSGKSPVIIGKNYSVEEAANRIIWGNVFNAGQTCVAPDYILVPEDKLVDFVRAARSACQRLYPDGLDNDSYTSVINNHHWQRVVHLMDDARDNSAEVIPLLDVDPAPLSARNKVVPSLVLQPGPECLISREEVFGPVMSVFVYKNASEAVQFIKQNPDPLALYVFSHHSDEVNYYTNRVSAGNVAVNDVLLQYLQNDLPFGGVGNSGSGKYHGKEGFRAFSNSQGVFTQSGPGNFTGLKLLYPPYGRITAMMIRALKFWP